MATDEVEAVLANWIEQALSSSGSLPEGISASTWVAARFADWWRERAADAMADAEHAVSSVRQELMLHGGWETFGEALHELAHLQGSLDELRGLLRLSGVPDP
jgi:hypothetical protein